jgi:hypothetical protein
MKILSGNRAKQWLWLVISLLACALSQRLSAAPTIQPKSEDAGSVLVEIRSVLKFAKPHTPAAPSEDNYSAIEPSVPASPAPDEYLAREAALCHVLESVC